MVEYFSEARDDPSRQASAAWAIYFLAGGKPRQLAPTRLLRRLAIEGAEIPEWLFEECYQSVGDLAETLALLLPEGEASDEEPLSVWMNARLLPLRAAPEEEKYTRLRDWALGIPGDQRLAFFKLITGAFRVGVSKLQVVQALAQASGLDEKRAAQRMIGFAQADRVLQGRDFLALIAPVAAGEAQTLDEGQPYPFYLAHSFQRPVEDMETVLGPTANWQAEWKFDGIRAQFVHRSGAWRLWSRGEELISDAYPEMAALSQSLPQGLALDGELVVMAPAGGPVGAGDLKGLQPFALLQQRLGRKQVSARTMQDLPVVFIAYDLLELDGRDIREEPQAVRRAALEKIVEESLRSARAANVQMPLRVSPTLHGADWQALAAVREGARALGVEGLMLKAREGAYGVGRRKGGDRIDIWWKWKLDPMSVDAVLIYAQRGHGRRSGVYSDYTFAVWSVEADRPDRALVPFAKAYSGLSDAEMRDVDSIIRNTTIETFGPVRSVSPTMVFELGFEGIAPSKRHKSGVAVRFPRMLRRRLDKPVAQADTLERLRALLPPAKNV
jgi:DNA ligase 1